MDETGNTELNFCYHCMTRLESGQSVCPVCGHDNLVNQNPPNTLPEGAILAGRYLVGRVLGQGGFGITYLGLGIDLKLRVAIKEYFPITACVRSTNLADVIPIASATKKDTFRNGRDEFQSEAGRLAAIDSPNIVKVRDFFRENGTSYIVMGYLEGNSLTKEAEERGGRLPWDEVLELFDPLILELDKLHEDHLLHRDIKPDNIKVVKDKNGKKHLVLLDFGSARNFASADASGSYMAYVTAGYAPYEQYIRHGKQGPYTDVYAICASMYAVLTGKVPLEATARKSGEGDLEDLRELGIDVPEDVSRAIMHGLAVDSKDRPQTMRELYDELNGKGPEGISAGALPAEREAPEPRKEEKAEVRKPAETAEPRKEEKPAAEPKPAEETKAKKKANWLLPVLLAVLLAAGVFLYRGIRQNKLNSAGTQTAEAGTSTQSALELAVRSTQDGQHTQTAQAGMTEQAAAAETQTARETQWALNVQQTGTAWNLTAAAEFQQTQTQAAAEASATQAKQNSRMEETVQVETQLAMETAAALRSEGTATSWFTTQEAQLHQTQTREAEELRETQAFFARQTAEVRETTAALEQTRVMAQQQTATQAAMEGMQTGTAIAEQTAAAERTAAAEQTAAALERIRIELEQTESAFHVMETEAVYRETRQALEMRMTSIAAADTQAAEPTATPTVEVTLTPTMTQTATATNTPQPTATPAIRVGNIITLGRYEQDGDLTNGAEAIEWQVLAVEDDRALVISRYGLDAKLYNDKWNRGTWETCTLRSWLNREFYDSAFSSEEKGRIQEVRLRNPDNLKHGTKGGNDTTDRIFLLSIEEAEQYFANDTARKCQPTTYAKNNGAYVSEIYAGMTWWWLRSPGDDDNDAAIVYTIGNVNDRGNIVNGIGGAVRPAFWLELDESSNGGEVTEMTEPPVSTNTPVPSTVPEPTGTPELAITAEPEYWVVSDTLLRDAPSGSAAVIRGVVKGTDFTYTGKSREADGKTWIQIKIETGNTGWIDRSAAGSKIYGFLKAGDIITLGHYEQDGDLSNGAEAIEWQVLASDLWDGQALVISKYGLDAKPYNEEYKSVTWETCTLRAWLNGEFYNSAFSDEEKERIRETKVKNTEGITTDRIFLLSKEEARQYFANDEALKCWPTAFAIKNGAEVSEAYGGIAFWWLRSLGFWENTASYVYVRINYNSVGSGITEKDNVARPAFWLDL